MNDFYTRVVSSEDKNYSDSDDGSDMDMTVHRWKVHMMLFRTIGRGGLGWRHGG